MSNWSFIADILTCSNKKIKVPESSTQSPKPTFQLQTSNTESKQDHVTEPSVTLFSFLKGLSQNLASTSIISQVKLKQMMDVILKPSHCYQLPEQIRDQIWR